MELLLKEYVIVEIEGFNPSFLIESSAFQVALQALNVGNGFQNHI